MEANKQTANDDWKNESLKSSLKFVSNENSRDEIKVPNILPIAGSMRNSNDMQQIKLR